jgi:hypothetical protein
MHVRSYGIALFGVLTLIACTDWGNSSGGSGRDDIVIATASTSGTIEAGVGGAGRNVAITFTTNDGLAASAFAVTNLASLPAGWTAPGSTFICSTVSTGIGCRLSLRYLPTSGGSGKLTIDYRYIDNAGYAKTGSFVIPYLATYGNNILATAAPSGQVSAVAGGSAVAVLVTFATDDGKPASSLTLTTALTGLPGGWSSVDSSFICSSVSTGNSCRLPLTFAPTGAGSGTLQLTYNYADSAGNPRSGSVDIPYTATSAPARLYVADSNAGTVLSCAIGNNGTPSGCAATGSGISNPTSIAFYTNGGSGNTYAYVSDSAFAGSVYTCDVNSGGSFSSCTNSGASTGSGGFNGYPGFLTVVGAALYIADANNFSGPVLCAAGTTGALSGCVTTNAVGGTNQAQAVAVSGSHAYIATAGDQSQPGLLVCAVGNGGSLSSCVDSGTGLTPGRMIVSGTFLYAVTGNSVNQCTIASDGSLGSCTAFAPTIGSSTPSIASVAIHNGVAYIAYTTFTPPFSFSSGVAYCPVAVDGSFANCTDSGMSISNAADVVVH